MGIVRPKILTMIEVPSGGWDLDFKISNASTLDTSLTATVPAGEYFVAWDHQLDDLLYRVTKAIRDAIVAAGLGTNRFVYTAIDEDNRVTIRFAGSSFVDSVGHENNVEITWASSHADLIKALGSDGVTWSSTGTNHPKWTATHQHSHGWYAREDIELDSLMRADRNIATIAQNTSLDGTTGTVLWGSRYENALSLQFLSSVQTWSDGTAYGNNPPYGYNKNQALECWWMAARSGTRFRVYRNESKLVSASGALAAGVNEYINSAYIGDSSKAWTTNQWAGMAVLFNTQSALVTEAARFFIASNTATRLYSGASIANGSTWDPSAGEAFYIHDLLYRTYILNTTEMSEWAPDELPQIDRYNIRIPLKRYV